jgi:hypothetical protein
MTGVGILLAVIVMLFLQSTKAMKTFITHNTDIWTPYIYAYTDDHTLFSLVYDVFHISLKHTCPHKGCIDDFRLLLEMNNLFIYHRRTAAPHYVHFDDVSENGYN